MSKYLLIVDDMPEEHTILADIFENMENFKIITAYNFEEAKTKLQEHSFAVAIVDVKLEENYYVSHLQGLELVELIKEKYPQTGTILMTAFPKKLEGQPSHVDAFFVRGNPTGNYPHLIYTPFSGKAVREAVKNLAKRFEGDQKC